MIGDFMKSTSNVSIKCEMTLINRLKLLKQILFYKTLKLGFPNTDIIEYNRVYV